MSNKQQTQKQIAEIIEVLKRPAAFRNRVDKAKLLAYLKTVEFFIQQHTEVCNEVLKKSTEPPTLDEFLLEIGNGLEYEVYRPGQIIFHHGDFGDKLYIVLIGSVNIYVQKNLEEIAENVKIVDKALEAAKQASSRGTRLTGNYQFPIPESAIPGLQENNMFTGINKEIFSKWHIFCQLYSPDDIMTLGIGQVPKYFKDGVVLYKKIVTLGAGVKFGELALQKNAPRAATIVAKEQLHVVTLNRAQFKKTFSAALDRDSDKDKLFQSLFPGIQKGTLTKVIKT